MRQRARRFKAEINVVPYIDVMLVLLIIFMVAAPLMSPGQINLPEAGAPTSATAAPLEVEISAAGQLRLKSRDPMREEVFGSIETLAARVRAEQASRPEQAVVIAADKGLRYEEVIRVLDALDSAGVRKIGLLTQPGSGG